MAVDAKPAKRGLADVLRDFREPAVVSMLFLGFSAGLPFYLVYQTLTAWLTKAGIARSTIGLMSLVGTMYTIKFLWAPIIDRVGLPLLDRLLGRRRSWMLVAQIGVAVCLANLAMADPGQGVLRVALLAVGVAFFAATQDIVVDAWRIESAPHGKQGAMAGAYQAGYRAALVTASAGALYLAGEYNFHVSYTVMAALMAVGIVTTIVVAEPPRPVATDVAQREQRVVDWLAKRTHWPQWTQDAGAWFFGAVVLPIVDFFSRYGLGLGGLIFAFISTYRLTEFAMGPMANPFYLNLGFSLKEIAVVAKIFAAPAAILGIVTGGFLLEKIGNLRTLVVGSVLIMISSLFYSALASYGCHLPLKCAAGGAIDLMTRIVEARGFANESKLAMIVSFDNFAQGVHGTALIAFMSYLTSSKYTATQYAVLSSLYALPGKLIMVASGFISEWLGFGDLFVYTAVLSIPGLLFLFLLVRRDFTAARD
jgi:PAT family beta-lactamase induction signal transducer AmpG